MKEARIEQIRHLRDTILYIAKSCHAERIAVFGSCARGTETAESDIDFLVSFSPTATLFDQIRLETELSKLFKTPIDVVSIAALKDDAY